MIKDKMVTFRGTNGLGVAGARYPMLRKAHSNPSGHVAQATPVTTALLLAAGTGTRLQPLTLDAPKCLTEVGDITILERLVNNLRARGFNRLIVVIGHLGDCIQKFLKQHASDMQVDYVINPDYRTTNNIYSLFLARQQIREPFLLVESDLVFEPWMLDDMLQTDKIAISNMRPWMNGTTVELGSDNQVTAFHMGGEHLGDARQYKTVNLYSVSLDSWGKIDKRLNHYISAGRFNEYYEAVFAEMIADGTLSFDAVFFDADRWYEIDTMEDLRAAENMFTRSRSTARRPLVTTEPEATVA